MRKNMYLIFMCFSIPTRTISDNVIINKNEPISLLNRTFTFCGLFSMQMTHVVHYFMIKKKKKLSKNKKNLQLLLIF